jgi:PAS domain S-box-containing protein
VAVTSIFQEAEANYKALVETASDAIVSMDSGGRVLLWNRAAERLFEYGMKDAIGLPLKELIFPDTHPAGLESPPCMVDAEVKTRGGRILPVEISISRRIGSSGAITTLIIKDITERKRAEEALSVSEARMRGILDATQESIWMFSPDGVILLANRTALARMGRTAQETIGKRFQEVLPPELAKAREERLREVVESGRPVEFEDERAGLRFNHTFYPVVDGTGRVTSVVSFSRDITKSKRAEETLRQTADRLKMAQTAARAGTWDWDVVSGNIEWSSHMFDLFGLDPLRDSASFETWRSVLHPDDVEIAGQRIAKALKERTALNSDYRVILSRLSFPSL